MNLTIQRKGVPQKSRKTSLAEAAVKAIVRKCPRHTIYRPSMRTELKIRKLQKSRLLWRKMRLFSLSPSLLFVICAKKKGSKWLEFNQWQLEHNNKPRKHLLAIHFRIPRKKWFMEDKEHYIWKILTSHSRWKATIWSSRILETCRNREKAS